MRMAGISHGKGALQPLRYLEADETSGLRFGIELGIPGPPWCLVSPGTPCSSHRKPSVSS